MQRSTRTWFVAFCTFAIVLACNTSHAADPLFPDLPEDFAVYAVGTYSGTTVVDDVELDDSGHSVKEVEVVVNKPGESVVLVLSAYDPVVWRVGHTEKTKIVGIVVGGYHGQALVGVDKKVPVAVSAYHDKKGDFKPFWVYGATPELFTMNDTIKEVVGQEINHFFFKPTEGVFYVGAPPVLYADKRSAKEILAERDLANDAVEAEPPKQNRKIRSGTKGLEQLVEEGNLRLATKADIDAWVDKASEKYQRFNPELRVATRMREGRTYVIEKQTTLPNGLFGAHSRSFIIKDEVPFPEGPRCHNSFYLMDGTEQGAHVRPQR